LLFSENNKKYAEIQSKVEGRYLRREDLADQDVARQFNDILERQDTLVASCGYAIDLIGHNGFVKGFLGNIYIQKNNELIIFDGSLISVRGLYGLGFFWLPVVWLASVRQKQIIKRYLRTME